MSRRPEETTFEVCSTCKEFVVGGETPEPLPAGWDPKEVAENLPVWEARENGDLVNFVYKLVNDEEEWSERDFYDEFISRCRGCLTHSPGERWAFVAYGHVSTPMERLAWAASAFNSETARAVCEFIGMGPAHGPKEGEG